MTHDPQETLDAAVEAACHQVRQAQRDLCFGTGGAMGPLEWLEAKGYAEGYAAALDTAREAVAVIRGKWVFGPRIYKHDALTVIDALREELHD